MHGSTGDVDRAILRFGLFLLPSLFTESALGVFSAGQGAPPGSAPFDTHVGLGLGLIAIAGWAFQSTFRTAGLPSRISSGTVLLSALGTAAVATTSLTINVQNAGIIERALSIGALVGAAGMIAAGASSARQHRHRPLAVAQQRAGSAAVAPGFLHAATGAFTIIAVLFLWFEAVGLLLAASLGLPSTSSQPLGVSFLGAGLLVVSIALAAWVFAFRRPHEMARSTFVTFQKLFGLAPWAELSGRTEDLVLRGPQRVVRHPLYLSVIIALAGWGLFMGSNIALLEVIPFVLWFMLLLIPFEERELRALYGDQYVRYVMRTPMLIPLPRRRRG